MAALNFSKKKPGRLSTTGLDILAFGSHFSANFQPILDCFIPNFKLKYEDSEDIKADRVNTVVSTYIKSNVGRFLGHQVEFDKFFPKSPKQAYNANITVEL